MQIDIPDTTLSVEVPSDWNAVALPKVLVFVGADEDPSLVGTEAYFPTRVGCFSIERARAGSVSTPIEFASRHSERLGARLDILPCGFHEDGVEFVWTDGVRLYRNWVVAVHGYLLDIAYITRSIEPAELPPEAVEGVVAAMVGSLRQIGTASPSDRIESRVDD